MTINQTVSEQMREFDSYRNYDGSEYGSYLHASIRGFIHSYTRKLIESLAEEIIPMNFEYCDSCQALVVENFGGWCSICKDTLNANRRYNQQRLKVKEILSNLK